MKKTSIQNRLKKIKRAVLFFSIVALMLVFIVFADRYVPTTFDGIKLWAVCVLPSLFPFFFLTLFLTKTFTLSLLCEVFEKPCRFLFRTGGVAAYVFFMSAISGYPVGARIIYELKTKNLIGKDEATRMSCFCSTSGPLFIVGSVGVGLLYDKTAGLIMLFSHLISALTVGVIFRNYGDKSCVTNIKPCFTKTESVLYDSIYNSVISVLCVGGFIAVFFTLSKILTDFKILYPLEIFFENILAFLGVEGVGKAFSVGLIECTLGCFELSKLASASSVAPLCCALISFGGISVLFQSAIYLVSAKIRVGIFLAAKTLHTVISFIICYLLFLLFY